MVEGSLKFGIILTLIFFFVELIGGYISGSLSLLADAGHMFRDVFALLLTLMAVNLSKRVPSKTRTFGYHRVEILAAFLNGILLVIISIWIFWEAYSRFQDPESIKGIYMFVVAVIGLLVNLIIVFKLHGSHDLNVRSAYLHVLTDTISSVAVIAASVWIYFTDQTIMDPILSVIIGLIILISSIKIIRESLYILLDFAPRDISFDSVVKDLESIKGIDEARNVHIRTLCSNIHSIQAHIQTRKGSMLNVERIRKKAKRMLDRKYNIKFATLEFECSTCRECGEMCVMDGKIRKLEH